MTCFFADYIASRERQCTDKHDYTRTDYPGEKSRADVVDTGSLYRTTIFAVTSGMRLGTGLPLRGLRWASTSDLRG
jgi:hypothetical protein